jgi:GTP-binding protein
MHTVRQVARTLGDAGIEATVQPFSALKREGVDDAHGILDQWLGVDSEPRARAATA